MAGAVYGQQSSSTGLTQEESLSFYDDLMDSLKKNGFSADQIEQFLDGMSGDGPMTDAEHEQMYTIWRQGDLEHVVKQTWGGVNWYDEVTPIAKIYSYSSDGKPVYEDSDGMLWDYCPNNHRCPDEQIRSEGEILDIESDPLDDYVEAWKRIIKDWESEPDDEWIEAWEQIITDWGPEPDDEWVKEW
ncbi:MAG: hypothetical protein JXA44_11840, partial [Methanospirillaceae archaeon]|nr:hypothetical protein [Methanospirillaceae archaeon]